ncbi:MAG: class I SAM-dependent methyltransferase [Candidatus Schekmanbacteria bacterium]|nr:MAG: class I SAM-dependent methyltransferase [Candidatus Schekmanbacteria bacterium]
MKEWIEFWDKENVVDEKVWEENAKLFFSNTLKVWSYDKDDIVLDIGCGKGYFAELIAEKVKELHLVDTSENCITHCKEKLKHLDNVFFHKLCEKDYTNLKFLNIKFTKIICLSVIQYFRNFKEVEELIMQCEKISADQGQLLIADIPLYANPLYDAYSLVNRGVRLGTLRQTINFLLRTTFGEYSKIRKKVGITKFCPKHFKSYLDNKGLEHEIHFKITTFDSVSRFNLLIKFNKIRLQKRIPKNDHLRKSFH